MTAVRANAYPGTAIHKGAIDCSANPNYPAADAGYLYRVSVAGKIGGGSGLNVEVGDLLLCNTDGTAAGTQAGVGASWTIIQANIDGAVVGPAAATDGAVAKFDGATGRLLKNGVVLGDSATKNVGTAAGTVAAGDDSRLNRYRKIFQWAFRMVAASITGAGDYTAGNAGTVQAPATVGQGALLVYLDPANGTKLRMAAAAAVNATAPGRTVIWGLYAIGTPVGGANVFDPTLGAVIAASQITFASGDLVAGAKLPETVTADFDCPAAGWYCLGVNASGAFTASSLVVTACRLEQKD